MLSIDSMIPRYLIRSSSRLLSAIGSARSSRRSRRPRYEEVAIFDEDSGLIYRVALPVSVLRAHLDITSRYIADTQMPRYIGAATGFGAAWALLSIMLFFVMQWPLVAAVTMTFMLGALGSVPGWIIGQKLGPKPQWLARRRGGVVEDLPVHDYAAEAHPDASFVAEIIDQRDLKFIYSGGRSKVQKLILTTLLVTLGCLIMAFVFMILIFTG